MGWYEKIKAAHLAVTESVSHFGRMKSDRYFVWQEDGRNDLAGDGVHAEKAVTGSTDLFTKLEKDPWVDEIEASFEAHGIAWSRGGTSYEKDTGFIHYDWDWEVLDGKA